MNTRLLSAVVCGALMFSLTGCFGGNARMTPSEIYNYSKDNGAKDLTYKELLDFQSKREPGEPFVVHIDGDEMTEHFENAWSGAFAYDLTADDVKEITLYGDGSDNMAITVMSLEFKDNDTASPFYDKYVARLSMITSSELSGASDDGEKDGIKYNILSYDQNGTHYIGAYLKGSCCLILSGDDSTVGKLCTDLGVPSAVNK